jgi:hypothetical protein
MKRRNSSKAPGSPGKAKRFSPIILRASLALLCLIALGAGLLLWPSGGLRAGATARVQGNQSPDGLWQEITETPALRSRAPALRPRSYRALQLNRSALAQLLQQAPLESSKAAKSAPVVMTLPLPDGTFAKFRIVETQVSLPSPAGQPANFKAYLGQGLDDPTATVRFDWSLNGFHAQVLSANDTVYVDPYAKGETEYYIAYYKGDARKEKDGFQCFVPGSGLGLRLAPSLLQQQQTPNGSMRRELRLAVAATGEYTTFFRQAGDTDEQAKERALAAIKTTLNRVNGIWERDLALRYLLLADADELKIIYTDGATDPYENGTASMAADQNQANLDSVIQDANYDIGHVFTTGGGGVGAAGVCETGGKARGATGSPNPVGDSFDVDYVAQCARGWLVHSRQSRADDGL